ncbi:AAA family ATPase [Candidatus Hepatoplasma crinochetorum]|uniref:AAA family ATPase n=1 Tax=Candidatus Hepatoplasma crinochetorum TaxID=295596 RepID=UPI0030850F63|nr:MAG: hypothetical protein HCTKY_5550 [Candidatus Hepatoplasma crinochetorum]
MNIEENRMIFQIEGIKSIFNKQIVNLYSNNVNLLLGINSSGKTSFLEGINFINENNENNKTKFLRKIEGSERINYKLESEEDIVSKVILNYKFSEEELNDLERNLNNLFSNEIKNKYMNFFRNNGRTIGSDSNGNNYLYSLDENSIYKKIVVDYLKNPNNDNFYKNFYNDIKDYENSLKNSTLLNKIYSKIQSVISFAKYGKFEKVTDFSYININNNRIHITSEIIFNSFLKISQTLTKKPQIIYIKSALKNGNLEYIYNLSYLFEKINSDSSFSEKAKINKIFDFLYPNKEELKIYYQMPSGNFKNEKRKEIESKITSKINKILEKFQFIDFSLKVNVLNNKIILNFDSKKNWLIGNKTGIDSSDGTKAFLDFIFIINSIIYQDSKNVKIIMVDEPENNLSIPLQIELKKYLKNLISENEDIFKNIYFVFATHSPFLYDKNFKVNIFERDNIGNTRIHFLNRTEKDIKANITKKETLKLLQIVFGIEEYLKEEFEENIFKESKKILYYNNNKEYIPSQIYETYFEFRPISSLAQLYKKIGEKGLNNFEQFEQEDYVDDSKIKELVDKMERNNKKFAVIFIQ